MFFLDTRKNKSGIKFKELEYRTYDRAKQGRIKKFDL